MATGKVRIFELAKEVGLTSKELITLFNERLNGVFEAKNQLSVVPDQIADLVRSVLTKPAPPAKAPAAPAQAPAPPPKRAAKPAAPPTQSEAVPTLKPVPVTRRPVTKPVQRHDGAARPAPQSAPPPTAPPGQRAPQPGRLIQPAPQRRPQGNGPFRPLTPPRPFRPVAPITEGPAPSSGGRPGDRVRDREEKLSKKDREKEQLLEKERTRKKRTETVAAPPPAKLETIEIPDLLTVQELATSMIVPPKDVIGELIKMGTMATINQNIPSDVAIAVAKKFGFNAVVKEAGEEVTVEQEEDKPDMLTPRPPVVTVLGHVDHGKTSLLDKIRSANVASGEAGGITQRIGAYTVEKNDRKITFIDTPGHEAFTEMRARGAKVTDVAVLVVAADDGVMPQTKEAIAHATAANVPIVVAMNKMDKPDAQPERVKQQLAEEGLQAVDWGGNIEMVPVSARTGEGIDSLLETVLLEADIRELRANKNRRASGV
ncbi:MAG TPA: translation initiation factor IF-2 N-terminal domain-containing protein, partial [Candidatus Rubrimentiphilum sp.]|nr:translation initiation factor IF-2 N-terminal domain-containing protein [Candidatus Rubrimentiphilum sp.]